MKISVFILCCTLIVGCHFVQGKPRIIGGDEARAGQFPFAAAMYIRKDTGTYFCSGSLLNNEWILTAAHCVDGSTTITTQLGSNHIKTSDPNRVIVVADEHILHPDYNPMTYDSDLALVRLRLPISLSDYIKPIELPLRDLPGYAVLTAIGWGQLNDDVAAPVENLNYVVVTSLSNDDCKLTYGDQITDSMVCAEGNFNEGTCTGDMGSPLIQYVNGNRASLAAVASFISANACEGTDPSGFIRVFPYLDWIKNVTSLE